MVDSNEPLHFILMALKPFGGKGVSYWVELAPAPTLSDTVPSLSCLLALTAWDSTPRRSGQVVQNGGIVPIGILFGSCSSQEMRDAGSPGWDPSEA